MSWIREQFTATDLQGLLFRLSQHVKAFQGLTPAEVSDLLGSSEKCTYAPGTHIVKEGNVGTHMYIILSGEARVLKAGRDGEVELAQLAPADSFGEMALVDQSPRTASAGASIDSELLSINRAALLTVIKQQPGFGVMLLRAVASRLRHMNTLLA